MNLEQLFSEKSVFSNAPYPLKPIQVPLFSVTDLSPHRGITCQVLSVFTNPVIKG